MSENTTPEEGKARVYKASRMLQQKIGTGPLNEADIERMQMAMDTNEVDFAPLGQKFLDELEAALTRAKKEDLDFAEKKSILTAPVMQLKANAAIFHYHLIGNLANVMLSFLEAIKELDKDALEIVAAHHTSLKAIIQKRISGAGGESGKMMVQELKDACARYYAKKKNK